MRTLAILGASGHGKVIADVAELTGWEKVDFFDDGWPGKSKIGRWLVTGNTETLLGTVSCYSGIVVGIGDCHARWNRYEILKRNGANLVSIIHPAAIVSPASKIGDGSVLLPGSIVNVDAFLGEACILNSGATVDHDCIISDAVHVAPGANISGNVTVGSQSWIGVGAVVKQGVRIGKNVMVGAGAVVINDVDDGETVIGNPAMKYEKRKC